MGGSDGSVRSRRADGGGGDDGPATRGGESSEVGHGLWGTLQGKRVLAAERVGRPLGQRRSQPLEWDPIFGRMLHLVSDGIRCRT